MFMKKVRRVLFFLIVLLVISLSSEVVHAIEKGDFTAPVYDAEKNQVIYEGKVYDFDRIGYIDKDKVKDGVKETNVMRFINHLDYNQRVMRYTTNGENWAWVIFNKHQDKTDNVNNFTIRDSDGDGKFDEKFGADIVFVLPDYLKKQ